MEISEVKKIRSMYEPLGGFKVWAADAHVYDNRKEGEEYVWDDTNGLLYVLRLNAEKIYNNKCPYTVEAVDYSIIQYMIQDVDLKQLSGIMNNLKSQNLITEKQTTKYLNDFNQIYNTGFNNM